MLITLLDVKPYFFILVAAIMMSLHSAVGQTNAVVLPGEFGLKLETVRFSKQKRPSLMGDGLAATIGIADAKDLQLFLDKVIATDDSWQKGPFGVVARDALKFLQGAIESYKVTGEVAKACDLPAMANSKDVYYRVEVRRNSSGYISDAWLWVIDPKTHLVIYLHEAT